MAKVPTYQRSQLPPGTTGIVKPPYELAERRGEIRFAETVTGLAGDLWSRIIQSDAINEQHEFLGVVDTELAAYEAKINKEPGAPFEQFEAWKQEMLTNIRKAGDKPRTGAAKDWIRNWYAENEQLIQTKAQAKLEAIQARRELERFNLTKENLIETGKFNELRSLYKGMSGKLLDEEKAALMLRTDMARLLGNLILKRAVLLPDDKAFELIDGANAFAKEQYHIEEDVFTDEDIAHLKQRYESTTATQRRLAAEELKHQQDLTGNRMLLSQLEGKLTDPLTVLDAQEKNLITSSMAGSLIKSMMSTEARETDLRALNKVNEAIDKLQDNPTFGQKQKTLEVLYANERRLSGTDAKSKLNEIYSDLQTAESQEDRMAYADINGILGGRRDPLSLEYFFEDDKAKEASIKGRLLYNEAVAKAKAEGKPLTAEQKTMLAVRIGRQLKRQLSEGKTGEEILPPAGAGMVQASRTLGTFKVPSPYPEISTDVEYDALPHGAIFIDKQTGLTYRKP